MNGKLLKKRLSSLVICVLIGLLLCPFLFLALLYLGWPPVIGNFMAARGMEQYAAQIYPEWQSEGHWAQYNLVDGGYSLSFYQEEDHFSLQSSSSGQVIWDGARALALEQRPEMDAAIQVLEGESPSLYEHISWGASWNPETPELPHISMRADCSDAADVPVPDEAAMREKMATRAMEVYDALSPLSPIHRVTVGYAHRGVDDKDGGQLWNRITVALPQGEPLTREHILSGALEVR